MTSVIVVVLSVASTVASAQTCGRAARRGGRRCRPGASRTAADFRYVATHICDSIKRRLRLDGTKGIQGEFGIGLLSFWTVGEELAMASAGADGRTYEMQMRKGDPSYGVTIRNALLQDVGTRLKIGPLLPRNAVHPDGPTLKT